MNLASFHENNNGVGEAIYPQYIPSIRESIPRNGAIAQERLRLELEADQAIVRRVIYLMIELGAL